MLEVGYCPHPITVYNGVFLNIYCLYEYVFMYIFSIFCWAGAVSKFEALLGRDLSFGLRDSGLAPPQYHVQRLA